MMARMIWKTKVQVFLTIFNLWITPVLSQNTTTDLPTIGGPYIMAEPGNQTVMDGQRVEIQCETEGFPNKIIYTWYKDNQDILSSNGYKVGRLKISSKGSLLITSAIKTDSGWYKCQPSNGLGIDEASAYINVIYKPVVRPMPSQITWARGHLQQLDCPVDANPKVTQIDWDKDQSPIEETGRFDILDNGTLLVSNVQKSDAGAYRCTPYNKLGPGLSSSRVQVVVKDPPTFTVRPDSMYQREIGQMVTLPCEATGTPPPSIVWKKESSSLDLDSPRITQHPNRLEITDLRKDDHGKYECLAVNTVNTVVTVTELRILNTTPHAPYNVTITPGLFHVDIQWEPGYNGGQTQLYVLWFRDVADDRWITMSVDAKSTSFSLHGLQPDTEYEFKVLARNSLGNGSFSKAVRARTLGYHRDLVTALPKDANGVTFFPDVVENIGPRPSAPSNLTASVKDTDINLRWQIPASSKVKIFYYQIEYRKDNGKWLKYDAKFRGVTTRTADLTDMSYGTYDIIVRAYGVLAFSAASNSIRVTIDDDDLVLPDALIGGIIGGILFLLVAVLLALVAIFHSRKKDRKAKNKKFNDVSYGKPDEMNGRSVEHPAQWDRWQQNGGGNFVTASSADNSIFFLPQTRSMDTRASLLLAEKRHSFRGREDERNIETGGRAVPSGSGRNFASMGEPHMVPLNATDLRQRENDGSISRSQPSSLRYRGEMNQEGINTSHSRSVPGSPPSYAAMRDPSHPSFPKSHSFPFHRHPLPQNSEQSPTIHSNYPPPQSNHPSHLSIPNARSGEKFHHDQPVSHQSFRSDDDDVFNTSASRPPVASNRSHGRPALPRHSSMVPSRTTYLTDSEMDQQSSQLNPPMFGVEDISSVLDRSLEQASQMRAPANIHSSLSPSSYPSGRNLRDTLASNIPSSILHPDWQDGRPEIMTAIPQQKNRAPSDNESVASSGRPLGYTRDHLQGAIQKLRQSQGIPPRQPHYMNNISSYSDPVAQSRTDLYDPDFIPRPVSSSHSHIPQPQDHIGRPDHRPTGHHFRPQSRRQDNQWRPRAHSEGSHGVLSFPSDGIDNGSGFGTSAPDVSHPVWRDPQKFDHSRNPNHYYHPERPYLPPSHQIPSHPPSNRSYVPHSFPQSTDSIPRHSVPVHQASVPGRYMSNQPSTSNPRHLDSTSSGIGSRNTSQSTGSFHPARRGSSGKGSTSFSSGMDPDLSLDTTGGGGGNGGGSHRRDTSADENYEFDSINALESDIIADLRRYSRLSNRDSLPPSRIDPAPSDSSDPLTSFPRPMNPSQYQDSEKRFERLREEFKQYRQQQQEHPQSQIHPGIPRNMGNLPLGSTGEPLYPMDSDML